MMIIEIAIAMIFGIITGTITGLLPGIHINTVVSVILASSVYFLELFPAIYISAYIMSMAITHSITEFIPTALLGIPDASTVVSNIPAHKLFSEGKALLAISTSVFSSVLAGLLTLLLFPLSGKIIDLFSQWITVNSVVIMLSFLVLLPLFLTNNRIHTITVIILASLLGVLSLQGNFLMPLLAGLFGIPVLISSLKGSSSNVSQQQEYPDKIITFSLLGRLLIAFCIGALFSYLPGAGSSAASLLAITIFPNLVKSPIEIIAVTSGLSTVNYVFSIYTYSHIDKARNGAIVGIRELFGVASNEIIFILVIVTVITLLLALVSTLILAKHATRILSHLSSIAYKRISLLMIIITMIIILLINGSMGFFFSIICTIVGLYAVNKNVQKVSMLSSLMVPTILLLLGVLG